MSSPSVLILSLSIVCLLTADWLSCGHDCRDNLTLQKWHIFLFSAAALASSPISLCLFVVFLPHFETALISPACGGPSSGLSLTQTRAVGGWGGQPGGAVSYRGDATLYCFGSQAVPRLLFQPLWHWISCPVSSGFTEAKLSNHDPNQVWQGSNAPLRNSSLFVWGRSITLRFVYLLLLYLSARLHIDPFFLLAVHTVCVLSHSVILCKLQKIIWRMLKILISYPYVHPS